MDEFPIIIEVGIPGPSGTGVTTTQWNTARADINRLLDPPVNPITRIGRRGGFVLAFPSSTYPSGFVLGDTTITFNLDTTKATWIEVWATTDITTASGKTASFQVILNNGTWNGNVDTTPSAAGTYLASSSVGLVLPPSITATVTAQMLLKTSDTTTATWAGFDIWGVARQIG